MVLLKEYLDRSEAAQSSRREKLRLLRAEVTEIDGWLRKLLAMVEAGAMQPEDPILAERVAQIRLHRQETSERITMLERELRLPGDQLSPEKIEACGRLLRDQLQNGDTAFRKAYLNLLVDRIEVDDAEVRIRGPKSVLAGAASGRLPNPSVAVPSFVREWRARFAVRDAASGLLYAIGEGLATETLAAEELARDSRHRPEGLARLWVSQSEGGPPSALKLGRRAIALLNGLPANDPRIQYPAGREPSVASLALWRALVASLLRDPETPLEEE
jgi:hypothetical protein